MRKFMNDKGSYVEESLTGILMAYSAELRSAPNDIRAIYSTESPTPGKVAIVTGGGYGHLPVFLGYVGSGLCDGVAVGNVFSPPSFDTVWNVTKNVNGGGGVLFLFGNYFGDNLSFMLAAEMAELEDIPHATVRVCDDVSSSSDRNERRGIAGVFFAYKIAGACACQMNPLEKVRDIAEKTVRNTATYGVAVSSCRLHSSVVPIFELEEAQMEFGMGIHGERGKKETTLVTSKELVKILLSDIIKDLQLVPDDRVAILVNGLGAAAHEDLYIVYKDALEYIESEGLIVSDSFVGEYATSLETAGVSITLLKLDDELLSYLKMPAHSPFLSIHEKH